MIDEGQGFGRETKNEPFDVQLQELATGINRNQQLYISLSLRINVVTNNFLFFSALQGSLSEHRGLPTNERDSSR